MYAPVRRTRIKICGITRPEDAAAAAAAGADAIGLVFYAGSPRAVTPERARALVAALPPFVTTVGLFVNASEQEVRAVLHQVPLDLLQFHGDETPAYCACFGRPYLKALRMRADLDPGREAQAFQGAAGLLLDAYRPDAYGGTGERFDWTRIPGTLSLPVVLAGGLDPDTVGQAVALARPYAVDVSSAVEAAKGIKDPQRIAAFVAAVRAADATSNQEHATCRTQ